MTAGLPSTPSFPSILPFPTIAESLRRGATRLAEAGIDNPRLESRLLLAHALGWTVEDLIRDLAAEAPRSAFDAFVARRAIHEPLALIVGWREFWSLRFRVSPATLIPRPDSETLVEAALAALPDAAAPVRLLDLGTGTGCLLLAFLHERRLAFGVGVDRSTEAVRLAHRNALDLGLADRTIFLAGDWAGAIASRFDLVLSNPPYIPTSDLALLMPEVRDHEPFAALDGGAGGLAAYRIILSDLPRLLKPGGLAILELGVGQCQAVADLAAASGFRAKVRHDLGGIARTLILSRWL